jgi:hypothetical protein
MKARHIILVILAVYIYVINTLLNINGYTVLYFLLDPSANTGKARLSLQLLQLKIRKLKGLGHEGNILFEGQ